MTADTGSRGGAAASMPWIGRPLPRYEDLRLVRGAGRYTDDYNLDGQVWAVFLRSPHAHARINGIDASAACALPGVLAVLTGEDYAADGLNSMPVWPVPAGALDVDDPVFKPTPDIPILHTPQWPLARGRSTYPGEAVAMIVAQTPAQARDAAEAVRVDYEILPAVTGMGAAMAPGAVQLWDTAPGNVAFENRFGDGEAAEAALANAHLVVEQTFVNQRIAVSFMEPRGGIGIYDARDDRYTLISGSQGVHRIRMGAMGAFGLPAEKFRVICPDTGGGFGSRNDPYPEQIAVLWAAKRVGRPVKWTNERNESLLTDYQGRDIETRARLGFDAQGHIVGLGLDILGNIGAQTLSYVQLHNTYRVAPSVYRVPAAALRVRGIMTNTVPTGPFRGAGRPEAMLAMERCMDIAAARLGIDRIELRRRNLVTRKEFPYTSAAGLIYDSGDFHGNLRRAMKAADWAGFGRRRKAALKAGRLAGIGIALYVESPVGAPHERVDVTVRVDERIELAIGTQSTGQGHETSFAQVMADLLHVHPDQISIVTGDTDRVVSGGGSHSDRSMRLGSALMVRACGEIIARARAVAAGILGVEEGDVAFDNGLFTAGERNRRLSLFDIARTLEEESRPGTHGRLAASAGFRGRMPAYPTGCAACEVEIERDTGVVHIVRYTAIDDAGQPINPLILHGQAHGGIAHGVGQALVEGMAYDVAGQVLTGSFMDYAMPRADLLPSFDVQLVEDATKGNPLRIKGGGEGGTTPALAAVMNAVCHALAPLGIGHIDMPATPARVWAAMARAERRA